MLIILWWINHLFFALNFKLFAEFVHILLLNAAVWQPHQAFHRLYKILVLQANKNSLGGVSVIAIVLGWSLAEQASHWHSLSDWHFGIWMFIFKQCETIHFYAPQNPSDLFCRQQWIKVVLSYSFVIEGILSQTAANYMSLQEFLFTCELITFAFSFGTSYRWCLVRFPTFDLKKLFIRGGYITLFTG